MEIKRLNEWEEFDDEPKPKLKMRSQMTHFIDYGDFEKFAKEAYPKLKGGRWGYSFAEVQESANDTSYTFNIDGKISKWEKKEVDQIRESGVVHSNYLLFNVLVADGYLEPGTYVVRVSW
jgi:hypothetical protein